MAPLVTSHLSLVITNILWSKLFFALSFDYGAPDYVYASNNLKCEN
jgi:hypothetical protein